MIKLIKKIKGESGQAMILLAVSFIVLCGMVGLAIDIGSVAVQKGDLQNGTDAAALAGSQDLPGNPTAARNSAIANATANGISNPTIVIDQNKITVTSTKSVDMYFSRIFGTSSKQTTVKATAVSGIANSVPWIVPFVIPQPPAFNYENIYVMRLYGSGPYPSGYSYSNDYTTDPLFKDYPIGVPPSTIYNINTDRTEVKRLLNGSIVSFSPKRYFDKVNQVDLLEVVNYGGINYYKVKGDAYRIKTNGSKAYDVGNPTTGYILTNQATVTYPGVVERIYPYQFDYMNINLTKPGVWADYVKWLEFGNNKKATVGDTVYYKAQSTGGQPSVDAFARRCTRDKNTDYTKAKVGDGRVILIPVVQSVLPRDTYSESQYIPLTILGFAAFFIIDVHENSYRESFWFEGRFLENITVDSDDVTYDPNADYGVRVTKLIYE